MNELRRNVVVGMALVVSIASLSMFSATPKASAAYMRLDNFETYLVGDNIDDQAFWSSAAAAGLATIAIDPADGSNQVLSQTGSSGGTFYERENRKVAEGDTGTLFLRFRYTAAPDNTTSLGLGMVDVSAAAPPTLGQLQPAFSILSYDREPRNEFNIRIANQAPPGGIRQVDFDDLLAPDTWYSLWTVMDNNSDNHQVYIQGGSITAQTQLFRSDNGSPDFPFRNGTTNDIITFMQYATSKHKGPFMLDDVYLDSSNDSHLINPIPEPSSALISCLLIAVIAAGARRRDARGIRRKPCG